MYIVTVWMMEKTIMRICVWKWTKQATTPEWMATITREKWWCSINPSNQLYCHWLTILITYRVCRPSSSRWLNNGYYDVYLCNLQRAYWDSIFNSISLQLHFIRNRKPQILTRLRIRMIRLRRQSKRGRWTWTMNSRPMISCNGILKQWKCPNWKKRSPQGICRQRVSKAITLTRWQCHQRF